MDYQNQQNFKLRTFSFVAAILFSIAFLLLFQGMQLFQSQLLLFLISSSPIIIFLLFNHDWCLYLFIGLLPLEMILTDEILTLPKIMGIILFISWLIFMLSKKQAIVINQSFIFMVIFLLWGLLSSIWTIDSDKTWTLLSTYSQLVLFYLVMINQSIDKPKFYKILRALFLGGLILVASGVSELLMYDEHIIVTERISGIAGNANLYVLWCFITIPGFYSIYIKGGWKKWFTIFGIISMIYTIAFAQSRGGLISILVFLLVILLFNKSRFTTLFMLVILGIFFWQITPQNYWERFLIIGNESVDRFRDIYPVGWEVFIHNFWLGRGLGTNGISLRQASSFLLINGAESVHSAPLALGMETGIIGLFIYIIFFTIPYFSMINTIRWFKIIQDKNMYSISIVIFASFSGFLFSWLKGGAIETSKILWLLLGLAFYLKQLTIKNNSKFEEN